MKMRFKKKKSSSLTWEKESKNFYYPHGPLSRIEIGDKLVQGEDFAYSPCEDYA